MEIFLQQVLNGLVLGSVYALVALGYTMVYGILGLINFAHGDVVMVGALTALSAMTVVAAAGLGLPGPLVLVLALAVSICVCMLLGFSIERIAYRPLRRDSRCYRCCFEKGRFDPARFARGGFDVQDLAR